LSTPVLKFFTELLLIFYRTFAKNSCRRGDLG